MFTGAISNYSVEPHHPPILNENAVDPPKMLKEIG